MIKIKREWYHILLLGILSLHIFIQFKLDLMDQANTKKYNFLSFVWIYCWLFTYWSEMDVMLIMLIISNHYQIYYNIHYEYLIFLLLHCLFYLVAFFFPFFYDIYNRIGKIWFVFDFIYIYVLFLYFTYKFYTVFCFFY